MKLAGLGESEAENCPRLRFMMWTGARLPKEIIGLLLESWWESKGASSQTRGQAPPLSRATLKWLMEKGHPRLEIHPLPFTRLLSMGMTFPIAGAHIWSTSQSHSPSGSPGPGSCLHPLTTTYSRMTYGGRRESPEGSASAEWPKQQVTP